jgi:hypothetical protein
MSPGRGSTPRQTDWLTVSRKVTWTWTWTWWELSVLHCGRFPQTFQRKTFSPIWGLEKKWCLVVYQNTRCESQKKIIFVKKRKKNLFVSLYRLLTRDAWVVFLGLSSSSNSLARLSVQCFNETKSNELFPGIVVGTGDITLKTSYAIIITFNFKGKKMYFNKPMLRGSLVTTARCILRL